MSQFFKVREAMSQIKLTNKGWLLIVPTCGSLQYLYFLRKDEAIIRAMELGLVLK
jgi:hypothetical protein